PIQTVSDSRPPVPSDTATRERDTLPAMPRKKLPAALARNALARAATARDRTLSEARAILSEIRRKQVQIADAFYDIGELLLKLRRDPIPKLLGRDSFDEVCEKDLGIS